MGRRASFGIMMFCMFITSKKALSVTVGHAQNLRQIRTYGNRKKRKIVNTISCYILKSEEKN